MACVTKGKVISNEMFKTQNIVDRLPNMCKIEPKQVNQIPSKHAKAIVKNV